jgi:hypothetical protein
MKSNEDFLMSVDAPGINRRRQVDGGVRGITKLHVDSDRLTGCEVGCSGNRHVRRPRKVACGVRQRHSSGHAGEENLQWAADRAAADIGEGHGPVERLTYPAVGQTGGCRGDLTRQYGRRQLDPIDTRDRYASVCSTARCLGRNSHRLG